MRMGFKSEHWSDHQARPAGGVTIGHGFTISWQNGPLGRGVDRVTPNGAFVEDVIMAAIDRIEFYQRSEFKCRENEDALGFLRMAAARLDERTKAREARQVEGTHSI